MNSINEKEYSIALAEVDDILYFTDKDIVSQIPSSFLKFIKDNKDKNYISNINPYMSLEEQDITDEARAIISLIYRSYIADEQEKQVFEQKDKEEFENIEKQKREKYNPDNIFRNDKKIEEHIEEKNVQDIDEQTDLVVINNNIFVKICNKIKYFFFKIIRK